MRSSRTRTKTRTKNQNTERNNKREKEEPTGQRALLGNREFHISKDRKTNTAKDEAWNKCNYTVSGTPR